MSNDIPIPSIEVIENGKQISSERIDPSVASFVYQAVAASNLARIRKLKEDETSQGWVENFDVAVTPASPSQEVALTLPAQSISITNDGPALVWVEINKRFYTRRTLNLGETLNINFGAHKLERFFVQCPPGLTATIRATARG